MGRGHGGHGPGRCRRCRRCHPRALQEQVRDRRDRAGAARASDGLGRAIGAPGPLLRFNGASPRVSFPSSYAATRRIEPFYKGGRIQVMPALEGHLGMPLLLALTFLFPIRFLQISRDGKFMFCPCGSKVNVIDVETGALLHSLQQVTGIGLS